MIIIAHRGLTEGPNTKIENTPEQIQKALDLGFDVEIDVRYREGKLWLGHDFEVTEMPANYLYLHMLGRIWFHCKNADSYEFFHTYEDRFDTNFFWHQKDDYVRTSKGWIWVYPGKKLLSKDSICVMPEDSGNLNIKWTKASGICTDLPLLYEYSLTKMK